MGLFTGTILIAAGLLAQICDTSLSNPYTLWLATICGLIVWLFVAVFHVRHESLTLPFQDRQAFLGRLRSQLKELGYHARVRESDVQVFWPSFQSLLFGGRIRLRLEDGIAHLDGPRMFLEILRQRLRVQNHLEKDLRIFWDARCRRDERLLKRVQISMRVNGNDWQGVCRQITQILAREGAEVQTEVILRARSDDGIRERMVEQLIREWLSQKNIPAVITKERFPGTDSSSEFCLKPPSLADTSLLPRKPPTEQVINLDTARELEAPHEPLPT
jgi:hypothetical protein